MYFITLRVFLVHESGAAIPPGDSSAYRCSHQKNEPLPPCWTVKLVSVSGWV